eukprot:14456461-Heterocapsa_arctica.AAC.1
MQSAALRDRRLLVKGDPDLAAQKCRTRYDPVICTMRKGRDAGGLVALKGGSAQLGPQTGRPPQLSRV